MPEEPKFFCACLHRPVFTERSACWWTYIRSLIRPLYAFASRFAEFNFSVQDRDGTLCVCQWFLHKQLDTMQEASTDSQNLKPLEADKPKTARIHPSKPKSLRMKNKKPETPGILYQIWTLLIVDRFWVQVHGQSLADSIGRKTYLKRRPAFDPIFKLQNVSFLWLAENVW